MEDPAERRARLKALKEAAALSERGDEEAGPAPEEDPAAAPVLKFRNYAVRDQKHIEHEKVAAAQPPKFVEPTVEAAKVEEATQEDVLVNVAPKKANWDLKRDVEKKLEKLERRTQRAILEIMQEDEIKKMQEDGIAD